MNERIKQLAKQASHQSLDGYPVTIPYIEIFVEKFAELIVEECCAQVERQYKYATKQTSTWSMSQDVQDMLKKHFGVEE